MDESLLAKVLNRLKERVEQSDVHSDQDLHGELLENISIFLFIVSFGLLVGGIVLPALCSGSHKHELRIAQLQARVDSQTQLTDKLMTNIKVECGEEFGISK